jgi:hypothetical protein
MDDEGNRAEGIRTRGTDGKLKAAGSLSFSGLIDLFPPPFHSAARGCRIRQRQHPGGRKKGGRTGRAVRAGPVPRNLQSGDCGKRVRSNNPDASKRSHLPISFVVETDRIVGSKRTVLGALGALVADQQVLAEIESREYS